MSDTSKQKVLVIDDDETTIIQVQKILNDHDYDVIDANDGASGLDKVRKENPDVILLDRKMPEMDGNQVLEKLKTGAQVTNIPVVMLTGDNNIADFAESLKLGAQDYIVKPFDSETLVNGVEKALRD